MKLEEALWQIDEETAGPFKCHVSDALHQAVAKLASHVVCVYSFRTVVYTSMASHSMASHHIMATQRKRRCGVGMVSAENQR